MLQYLPLRVNYDLAPQKPAMGRAPPLSLAFEALLGLALASDH